MKELNFTTCGNKRNMQWFWFAESTGNLLEVFGGAKKD